MRRVLALLCTVATVALAACGSDSVSGLNDVTPASVVGSYTLKSVNGASLPAVLAQSATQKVVVLDDMTTLNADNTYTQVGHYQVITGVDTVSGATNDTGSFTLLDGAVTLSSTTGKTSAFVLVDGNQLTATLGGATLVFSR